MIYASIKINFKNNELNQKIEKLKIERQEIIKILDKEKDKVEIEYNLKKLDKIIDNIEIYYKITNNFMNNYNIRNKNYILLMNINNINDYNKKIIKDIDNIINENIIENKFVYISDIYEKM